MSFVLKRLPVWILPLVLAGCGNKEISGGGDLIAPAMTGEKGPLAGSDSKVRPTIAPTLPPRHADGTIIDGTSLNPTPGGGAFPTPPATPPGELDLNLLELARAPRLGDVYLDSNALKSLFLPIFGSTPRANLPAGEFFSHDEKAALGTYLPVAASGRRTQVERLAKLRQEYLFTLRDFLSEACSRLVERESAQPANANNRFVRSLTAAPTGAQVNDTMSEFFGASPPQGTLHAGASELSAIFARKIVGDDTVGKVKRNATLLCVTIGSDPRTFMR